MKYVFGIDILFAFLGWWHSRACDDKMYSVFNIHIILHFILNLLHINEPKYVKQINHFIKQDKI